MSRIDGYEHHLLGMVACPSTFPIVYANDSQRTVPVYRLDEDAPDETDFQGKRGDILVGGGSGESPAFRIAVPESFYFYTHDSWGEFDTYDKIHRAFWTMTEAFVFCEGYQKLGWTPTKGIEQWLTEHVLSFLLQYYSKDYVHLTGAETLEEDGSVCRLPTDQEMAVGGLPASS